MAGVVNTGGAPVRDFSPVDIRRIVLECSHRARVGHIGSSLCIAEILTALYGSVMRGGPSDPNRDRFVLSKGHAALALYAALALKGSIDPRELASFCASPTRLGVHPEPGTPGVDIGTGSLGQGLSVGAGFALGARLSAASFRTFVLLSDAELNEGAVWEAAQFAGHHRLRSLIAVVDLNGQQAFGYTNEVLAIPDPASAFTAFGWEVLTVDGHDESALTAALDVASSTGPPRIIFAKTVFGRGVSFMEGQLAWHYLPLTDPQYVAAIKELVGS